MWNWKDKQYKTKQIFIFQAIDNSGSRLSEEEKNRVRTECNNQLRWLESHGDASMDEYETHLKDLQAVCQPAMMRLHGAGGTGGGPSTQQRPESGGPRVTEIDWNIDIKNTW